MLSTHPCWSNRTITPTEPARPRPLSPGPGIPTQGEQVPPTKDLLSRYELGRWYQPEPPLPAWLQPR